jgi:coenzyme PQQ synthesis protein D (PqqD)
MFRHIVLTLTCDGGLFFSGNCRKAHGQSALREEVAMKVERVNCGNFAINTMPDGSRIIRKSDDTVLALNSTAAAAWDACTSATTIAEVAETMRRSFNPDVTNELAEASVMELQDKKLVTISGSEFKATRRQLLAGLGAVALPLVVSLTVGEQKAHAEHASSMDHGKSRRPRANVPKNQKRPF